MQKQRTDDKLAAMAEALRINPDATRAELVEMLGVTPARISQLRKQLALQYVNPGSDTRVEV